MKRLFLEVQMVNFSDLRSEMISDESEEDTSYERVLRELNLNSIDMNPKQIPLDQLPLFRCLIEFSDVHCLSPLDNKGCVGYCQMDFKDNTRSYVKLDYELLKDKLIASGSSEIFIL